MVHYGILTVVRESVMVHYGILGGVRESVRAHYGICERCEGIREGS